MDLNLPRSGLVQQAYRVDRPPYSLCCATASFLPATQGQRCHLDNITLPQAAHVCYIYVVQDVSPLDCLHGHVKLTVVKVQTC